MMALMNSKKIYLATIAASFLLLFTISSVHAQDFGGDLTNQNFDFDPTLRIVNFSCQMDGINRLCVDSTVQRGVYGGRTYTIKDTNCERQSGFLWDVIDLDNSTSYNTTFVTEDFFQPQCINRGRYGACTQYDSSVPELTTRNITCNIVFDRTQQNIERNFRGIDIYSTKNIKMITTEIEGVQNIFGSIQAGERKKVDYASPVRGTNITINITVDPRCTVQDVLDAAGRSTGMRNRVCEYEIGFYDIDPLPTYAVVNINNMEPSRRVFTPNESVTIEGMVTLEDFKCNGGVRFSCEYVGVSGCGQTVRKRWHGGTTTNFYCNPCGGAGIYDSCTHTTKTGPSPTLLLTILAPALAGNWALVLKNFVKYEVNQYGTAFLVNQLGIDSTLASILVSQAQSGAFNINNLKNHLDDVVINIAKSYAEQYLKSAAAAEIDKKFGGGTAWEQLVSGFAKMVISDLKLKGGSVQLRGLDVKDMTITNWSYYVFKSGQHVVEQRLSQVVIKNLDIKNDFVKALIVQQMTTTISKEISNYTERYNFEVNEDQIKLQALMKKMETQNKLIADRDALKNKQNPSPDEIKKIDELDAQIGSIQAELIAPSMVNQATDILEANYVNAKTDAERENVKAQLAQIIADDERMKKELQMLEDRRNLKYYEDKVEKLKNLVATYYEIQSYMALWKSVQESGPSDTCICKKKTPISGQYMSMSDVGLFPCNDQSYPYSDRITVFEPSVLNGTEMVPVLKYRYFCYKDIPEQAWNVSLVVLNANNEEVKRYDNVTDASGLFVFGIRTPEEPGYYTFRLDARE